VAIMKPWRVFLCCLPLATAFNNPVIWEDLADIDILRHNGTYYMSTSTMHHTPGAPILSSPDLVNWKYISHSVPHLEFGDVSKYDLKRGSAYNKGIWASFLNVVNGVWIWGGCVDGKTYIYAAREVAGPWEKRATIARCYYDAGLVVDGQNLYVMYGNKGISVAQLSADATREVSNKKVWDLPRNIGTMEGSRPYKIKGNYYIAVTRPPDAEFVLRSDKVWGPYTLHPLVDKIRPPVAGSGAPHQGGFVEDGKGGWFYMAFIDAYPGGRIPVLAPMVWEGGWPKLQGGSSAWSTSYNSPAARNEAREPKVDGFEGKELGPEWEWNHNPDTSKFSVQGGLVLKTATVTEDFYLARNTLTRRITGPKSTATMEMDVSSMANGDVAGLGVMRHISAWIGVMKTDGGVEVVVRTGISLDKKFLRTTSKGSAGKMEKFGGAKVWLRATADIRPGSSNRAEFSYSRDGTTFKQLGTFGLAKGWEGYFLGYRWALFNYASKALGGSVKVSSFTAT